MKNFKKVVAAGLALLMLALSVNVTFAAESYTDKEAVVVAKVNAAGIMTGTDKGFEPSKTLTRAEAAAIMVRMKGISEDTVKQNAGATLFTDVAASHWAAGYVNVAFNYDIIKGVGANKFAPEKEVTVAEFYTMAARALNAGKLIEAEGTWPTNYVNFAIENDLAEDVAQIYTAAATRMTAATIVANTLEAKMWKKSEVKTNGEITWKEDGNKNILNDVLKIFEATNVGVKTTNSKKLTWEAETGAVEDANQAMPGKYAEKAALETAKPGMRYSVWYNKDEVLGFWIPDDNSKTIYFENIKSISDSKEIKLTVDGEEKEYDLADAIFVAKNGSTPATVKVRLNGATGETSYEANELGLTTFGVAYQDPDNDDKITSIYVESYDTMGVVKEIKNEKIYFETSIDGANASSYLKINKDDNTYSVTKDGKAISIDDIEEGDALYMYGTATTKVVIDVLNDTVDGKVKSYSTSSKKATIDGTQYSVLKSLTAGNKVKAGTEGTFYLDKAGKIAMVNPEEKVAGDFAIISAWRTSTDKYDGTTIYEVKLQGFDGEVTDWIEVNTDKTETNGFDIETAVLGKVSKKSLAVAAGKKLDGTTLTDAETSASTRYFVGTEGTDYYSTAVKAAVAAGYGQIVTYKLKDNKVIFTDLTTADGAKVAEATAYTDANISYVTVGSSKVFAKDSSVAFELDDNDKTGWELVISLKDINIEDLDSHAISGAIADIDYKEGEFGLLLIYEGSTIKTDRTFAFIVSRDDFDDDDDDVEFNYEYKVLYAGESSTKTLYSKDDIAEAGKTYELSVSGDEITRADDSHAAEQADLANTFINKTYKNGQIEFVYKDSSNEVAVKTATIGSDTLSRFVLAEDLIVVELDGSDYKVRSLNNLTELNETVGEDWDVDTEDESKMVTVVTYTDDDETEIIAIVFQKA